MCFKCTTTGSYCQEEMPVSSGTILLKKLENEVGRKGMHNCHSAIETEDINNSLALPCWKRMNIHLWLNIQVFKQCLFCRLPFVIYFQTLNREILLYIFIVKSLTKIFRWAFWLFAGYCSDILIF